MSAMSDDGRSEVAGSPLLSEGSRQLLVHCEKQADERAVIIAEGKNSGFMNLSSKITFERKKQLGIQLQCS